MSYESRMCERPKVKHTIIRTSECTEHRSSSHRRVALKGDAGPAKLYRKLAYHFWGSAVIRADLAYEDPGTHTTATLGEVAAIADVRPEVLRRDLDRKIIWSAFSNRLRFYPADIVCLAVLYHGRSKLLATPAVRKTIFSAYRDRIEKTSIDHWVPLLIKPHGPKPSRLILDTFLYHHIVYPVRTDLGIEEWLFSVDDVTLTIKRTCEFVAPRVDLYYEGLKRTEIREDTAGGERLFRGSRLTIRNVAEMLEAGDTVEMVLEDYPYLSRDDVEFARLYHRANPPRGRPRDGAGGDGAEADPG